MAGNLPPPTVSNLSEEDFPPLVRQHGARIYALSVRLCGNTTDGDDLAQETFVAAFRRIRQFRGEADIGSWLYRICVNLWKNRVRYEKRRAFWRHISLFARSREDDDPPAFDIPDPADVTDGPALMEERRVCVRHALARLDPRERAVLILREMEDKSYDEIADLLGVPVGTVKSRIARARDSMRALLRPLLGHTP